MCFRAIRPHRYMPRSSLRQQASTGSNYKTKPNVQDNSQEGPLLQHVNELSAPPKMQLVNEETVWAICSCQVQVQTSKGKAGACSPKGTWQLSRSGVCGGLGLPPCRGAWSMWGAPLHSPRALRRVFCLSPTLRSGLGILGERGTQWVALPSGLSHLRLMPHHPHPAATEPSRPTI